jgi:type II secretory pathway predicted ATPase ExeA
MFEAYFGLKYLPFRQEIKTAELIQTFDHKEAEARLNYLKTHRGIMRLTGEPGSGKTSILRKWVDGLNPQSYLHCYTPHATVSKTDLYRQINSLLSLPPKMRKSDLFNQIQSAIWAQYTQGKVTCLIFDECQMMDHATLQELVPLTNFVMDSKLPFILLLVGQPELLDKLNRAIHEPLRQRIHIHYHMAGLDVSETKRYIEEQLAQAGRKDPLFIEASFSVIHQLANGLPRKINSLVLAAMRMAMLEKRKLIDGDLILKISPEALG